MSQKCHCFLRLWSTLMSIGIAGQYEQMHLTHKLPASSHCLKLSFALRTCITHLYLELSSSSLQVDTVNAFILKVFAWCKIASSVLCVTVWWHQFLPYFYSCTLEKHLSFYDIRHWYVQPFCITKASLSIVCERCAFGEPENWHSELWHVADPNSHSAHLSVSGW